jgi:hypothetical protein
MGAGMRSDCEKLLNEQRIAMTLLAPSSLFEHEWAALKDALMRDIEREMAMAQADTDFSHSHLYNARMSQRILQVISGEEKRA